MYICFSYVPHEKSKFYELYEIDFHETIESIVLEYSDKGEVFVCGDLNSRIGEINDVLYNDELDQYVMSVEHVENPTIPNSLYGQVGKRSWSKTVTNVLQYRSHCS